MTPFDAAWEVAKADTGMWDEIYAPLLAQTTGMGDLDAAKFFTDFVPTDFAVSTIPPTNDSFLNPRELGAEEYLEVLRRNIGDHGYDVDSLAESIMEEGYNPDRFIQRTGRMDPSFEVNQSGLNAYEGRHRLLALDKLGAPYVPFAGSFVNSVRTNHDHPFPMSPKFNRDTALFSNGGEASPWSIGGYMRRGRTQIPSSYIYGREMVPGMGRLVPDVGDDSRTEQVNRLIREWLDYEGKGPSWKVIYDDEL